MRLLVVNADDYALTAGISRAILRAHREGIVTSTSVLANGLAFESEIPRLRECPSLSVGVHLALAGGDPPVLPPRELPTLAPYGRLPESWRAFSWRWLSGRIARNEVAREMEAQLARVEAAGIHPTHLDGHQYLHLLPGVRDEVLALARAHGVVAAGVPRSRGVRLAGRVLNPLARAFESRARASGIVCPGDAAGFDEAGGLAARALDRALATLAEGGARTAVLNVHPGEDPDPDRARYPWGYAWAEELSALRDPALRGRIDSLGFTLAGYDALAPAPAGRTA